jgi:DNA-binding MarR family transcriptional regulator
MASDPSQTASEVSLLVADLYEAAGAVRKHGDRVAAASGQTQARWQLLSVISQGDWTVPHVARRLGLSRQAVQRVADELIVDGLLRTAANPNHRRSPLIGPTEDGRQALATISDAAVAWNAEIAAQVTARDLTATRAVLRTLIESVRP